MIIKWNQAEERRLFLSPSGPLANDLKRRGRNAVQAARPRAPVLTGLLQSTIAARIDADHRGLYMDLVDTATSPRGFPYPVVQEARRPFMRPAINAMRR